MKWLALVGLLWIGWSQDPYPKEVLGTWYQTFGPGIGDDDSVVVTFQPNGSFTGRIVVLEFGWNGVEVRARQAIRGRWKVRPPVDGEFPSLASDFWKEHAPKRDVLCMQHTDPFDWVGCGTYGVEDNHLNWDSSFENGPGNMVRLFMLGFKRLK